eukprot:Selendium_serpulae@DN5890_c0_g1_i3.p2
MNHLSSRLVCRYGAVPVQRAALGCGRRQFEFRGAPHPTPPYNEWLTNHKPHDPKDPRYDPNYVEPLTQTHRLFLEHSTTDEMNYAYGLSFKECMYVFGAPLAVLWFGLGWSASPGFSY